MTKFGEITTVHIGEITTVHNIPKDVIIITETDKRKIREAILVLSFSFAWSKETEEEVLSKFEAKFSGNNND